jgi:glycosyltransferase involved in cell wall biosynthesis
VKALKKNNPLLHIVVIAFQYPFIRHTYKWNDVTVIALGGRNKGRFSRLITWLNVFRIFRKLYGENNIISLLSCWLGECALVGKLLGKKYNIKHYCWMLGQDARKGNRYYQLIRPRGPELIAISDSVKKEFYKNYAIKIDAVIPIGIDNTLFDAKSLLRTIDIIGVGSLITLKRYDLFIEIISDIKKTYPHISSVILGEGQQREKLQQLIIDKKLSDNISLSGAVSHAAVIRYMQQSKILLHTSSYEGFSTVCAEALRAGMQVISFCKPMEFDYPNWYIVNNEKEMLEKCLILLDSNNNVTKSVTTITIEDSVSRFMNLIDT